MDKILQLLNSARKPDGVTIFLIDRLITGQNLTLVSKSDPPVLCTYFSTDHCPEITLQCSNTGHIDESKLYQISELPGIDWVVLFTTRQFVFLSMCN